MADTITAEILRYDPSIDDAPHFETYEVEWVDDPSGIMTALQVLHAIHFDQEQIAYDYCCNSNLCGRCSMMIDGKPSLACWTPLRPGTHRFEPLSGFPVIKDLLVDHEKAYARFIEANVAIQTVDPIVDLPDIDYDLYWNTLEKLNMCRECMCCYALCPQMQGATGNPKNYIGPGAMMGIAQRYFDTEDQSDRLAQAVFSGLFDCQQCGTCTMYCSADIDITGIIKQMRDDASDRGIEPKKEAEFM